MSTKRVACKKQKKTSCKKDGKCKWCTVSKDCRVQTGRCPTGRPVGRPRKVYHVDPKINKIVGNRRAAERKRRRKGTKTRRSCGSKQTKAKCNRMRFLYGEKVGMKRCKWCNGDCKTLKGYCPTGRPVGRPKGSKDKVKRKVGPRKSAAPKKPASYKKQDTHVPLSQAERAKLRARIARLVKAEKDTRTPLTLRRRRPVTAAKKAAPKKKTGPKKKAAPKKKKTVAARRTGRPSRTRQAPQRLGTYV